MQERGATKPRRCATRSWLRSAKRGSGERRRLLARVALDVHQQRLVAREALLDQVWAEAERQLRALPGQPAYGEVLRRLALAAAPVLGQGHYHPGSRSQWVIALLTAERLAEWSAAAPSPFMRAEQPAPIWGGLLAWDVDTRRQVDASFATRLALAHAESREQVARDLGESYE